MFQIRIVVKLGGPVGELGLFNQDLADLCDIQPKLAGEWISGGIERPSLEDLSFRSFRRAVRELELRSLIDGKRLHFIGRTIRIKGNIHDQIDLEAYVCSRHKKPDRICVFIIHRHCRTD